MIERIPQREQMDCTICAVAMVLGAPYTYERVLVDSARYTKVSSDGKFLSWWEPYLNAEGRRTVWRPFMDLYQLAGSVGRVIGLLQLDNPDLRVGHIVAVDELGVVDPADGMPDHMDIPEYVLDRREWGFRCHPEFLAVERPV